ncbi:Gamma interferon inducible lysosomal thiol reductase GILT [Cinara cedri]|uniref:Gamma interferon inducible lysosomal thiol reductase GILT n=1 Tax=Cinara cedri TaxID=506608 RepID=A0A5E4MEI9_9HEMI|nr:Gamma interferon inducible lysosomal thiol reductase GILT [Cinara cedri]
MESRSRNYSYAVLVLVAFALGNLATASASDPEPTTTVIPVTNGNTSLPAVPTVVVTSPQANSENVKTSPVTNNDTTLLPIDIYYEGLCKDSVNFMEQQFLPVYNKLSAYVEVNFIPFSQGQFNETTGNTTIHCKRNGECDADKVHACAIKYIQKKDDLVKFIVCALNEGYKNKPNPISVDTCGNQSGVNASIVDSIKTCVSNYTEYLPLLKDDYNKAITEHVTTVPRIVFNKTYTNETENLAESHFLNAVCSVIKNKPEACKDINSGSETIVAGILPILISVYYLIRMF